MAEEIITKIIEKNHNNEICTFPQRTLIIPRAREKQPEKKYAETMGNIHPPELGKIRNAYANVWEGYPGIPELLGRREFGNGNNN